MFSAYWGHNKLTNCRPLKENKLIGEVFVFFKKLLDSHLGGITVGFPPTIGDNDSISFADGLNLVLVNLEQDESTRPANPYIRKEGDSFYNVMPEIRLNVHLLAIANWKSDYVSGLNALAKVIRFFQARRVFRQEDKYPGGTTFPEGVEQLFVDMIALPYKEQNEVWNALRTHYRPSALFRVRMIIFRQEIDKDKPVPVVEEGKATHLVSPAGKDFYLVYAFPPNAEEPTILSESSLNDFSLHKAKGTFKDKVAKVTVVDSNISNSRKNTIRTFLKEKLSIDPKEPNKVDFQKQAGELKEPYEGKIIIHYEEKEKKE